MRQIRPNKEFSKFILRRPSRAKRELNEMEKLVPGLGYFENPRGNTFLTILMVTLTLATTSVTRADPIREINIDGVFNDWSIVPGYTDPINDQHDTDHDGQFDTPAPVTHDDVDILEYKFAHDAENLCAYFRSRGSIGRTQSQSPGRRAGRYYAIVTIDVDNDDSTGYWLHEGGYYPTSRGYDMNMELEFFNGMLNTGHYLSHDALDDAGEIQDTLTLTNGQWNGVSDGPYTPGTVTPAPGNYPNYTQWSYHSNDTLTLVRDQGPIVPGIMSMALSPDGHELEFCAPFKGFLRNSSDNANIALGKTIDISMSLEASGELFATSGNGTWASDTATPIIGYELGANVPEPSMFVALWILAVYGCWSARRTRGH